MKAGDKVKVKPKVLRLLTKDWRGMFTNWKTLRTFYGGTHEIDHTRDVYGDGRLIALYFKYPKKMPSDFPKLSDGWAGRADAKQEIKSN